LYKSEIGRLGQIKFLRPSEHGKHFSITGPKPSSTNISHFCNDWQSGTLANLFWSWFDDMMMPDNSSLYEDSFNFLRAAGPLWDRFCEGRNIRIAIYTSVSIGELNGVALKHLAIDLDLEVKVAHAYPITEAEAKQIMGPFDVRLIKPQEY
jgi:hypothetical protein